MMVAAAARRSHRSDPIASRGGYSRSRSGEGAVRRGGGQEFRYAVTWVNGAVGASVVAMFLPLQPVAAAALGWVFLGDAVYSGTLAGGVAIAAGLASVTAGRAAGTTDAGERARVLLPRTKSADVLQ